SALVWYCCAAVAYDTSPVAFPLLIGELQWLENPP
ncbi:hypothetical protein A2U01_0113236, partial [Trifolium medium]|nr:hypothetical protein [Trifolium medium]